MKNNEEWKFEPDPFTRRYIDYLDKSPIKFNALRYQLIYLNEIEKERNLTDSEKKSDKMKKIIGENA